MSSFTERRQRITDTAGVLLLVELSAPSFGAALRLANDTDDWVSNGQTYIGFPFRFTLPDDVSGQSPRAQLVVDNVGRSLTEDLEGLQPNEVVTARVLVTDRHAPDIIEHTLVLPLTRVTVTQATVTADCGVDYIMRQQAVRLRANPFTLPGIFQ